MKIELPEGATVGSVVGVNYHESGSEAVVTGESEGRITAIDGHIVTVHFEYGNWNPPRETLRLNLETGVDEDYDVPITEIKLVARRAEH